eukprot:4580171-Pleurochrysis_carterae.AAC.2
MRIPGVHMKRAHMSPHERVSTCEHPSRPTHSHKQTRRGILSCDLDKRRVHTVRAIPPPTPCPAHHFRTHSARRL